MRVVKKVPKSAKCFNENEDDEVELYATHKCAYLVFKNGGKFVNGEFVRIPNKKTILRFTPEELEEFMYGIFNAFRRIELIEGKYVQNYIV